jgi:NCS1 family nucleobase:cation symporter-1
MIALVLGIAPCVPGFLAAVSESWAAALPPIWTSLYHYAWFIRFGISFVVYVVLMAMFDAKMNREA